MGAVEIEERPIRVKPPEKLRYFGCPVHGAQLASWEDLDKCPICGRPFRWVERTQTSFEYELQEKLTKRGYTLKTRVIRPPFWEFSAPERFRRSRDFCVEEYMCWIVDEVKVLPPIDSDLKPITLHGKFVYCDDMRRQKRVYRIA